MYAEKGTRTARYMKISSVDKQSSSLQFLREKIADASVSTMNMYTAQ